MWSVVSIFMKESNCTVCNKHIRYNPHSKGGKYCSNKCQGLERKNTQNEINKKLLLDGKLSDINRIRIKKTMIYIGILEECSICKTSEWLNKKLPMILDHIDGNSSNNSLKNLRFLCSNCDSLTPYYKARNKGKGRKSLALSTK